MERGLIEWDGREWKTYLHEGFATGWETAPELIAEGYTALIYHYHIDPQKVKSKEILKTPPNSLEELSMIKNK